MTANIIFTFTLPSDFNPVNPIILPITGSVNVTVDWGDSSSPQSYTSNNPQYIYTNPGTYNISVTGTFTTLTSSGGSYGLYLVDFAYNIQIPALTNFANAFYAVTSPFTLTLANHSVTNNVTDMSYMFNGASSFNRDISFNTSNVTNMSNMFAFTEAFNKPINFDTSKVTNMSNMFYSPFSNGIPFNSPITFTDTSKVTDINGMFNGAIVFNYPINFDTSSVTNMSNMFNGARAFNQDISFNTSQVTNLSGMFANNSFNSNIHFNDTSKVTNMNGMFCASAFNQPLSLNTSSVTDMGYMFFGSAYNKPLNFDTSLVSNMNSMFGMSSFNQDISSWNISNLTNAGAMFDNNSGLSSDNYNNLLIGWGNQSTIQPNVPLGADSITYTTSFAKHAHDILTNTYNWSITDGGYVASIVCFKEGSKILTNKGYKPIETLKSGDLVKTLKNGFKPIYKIGKRDIFHPAEKNRIKDQLYKFSKDKHPDVFEDLVLTGCHSVLIDTFKSEEQKQKAIEINSGRLCVTDRKYRLPSCLDERAVVYEKPGKYTIYHIALENDDYIMNYGIYANGLLVETCSKRYLNELSGMILL